MAESSGPDLRSIALFPLNVVLFPGMRLPLHIFEERYRLMIRRCLDEGLEFGVSLIRSGVEVGGPATPFPIGTLTRLRDVTRLPDGRYTLLAEGTRRFRLVELTAQEPYLQGLAEILPEDAPSPEDVAPVVENVGRLFRRYWEQLFELAGRPMAELTTAADPRELSYQIAGTLQIERVEKQQLLEIDRVEERLREEVAILRNQNEALERIIRERRENPEPPKSPFRFSVN